MNLANAPTYLYYTLTLCSSAIVSTLSGDPNSAATQQFIPGSAIRGTVAARLLSNGITADSEVFQALVLSGAVCYLHAYPEIAGDRALPTPASWRSEKDEPGFALDLAAFSGVIAHEHDIEDFAESWPEKALVPVAAPFVTPFTAAGRRSVAAPRLNARVHQQRDRVKGRPWKDSNEQHYGAIFAYEYLEAEQVFCGTIQMMPTATRYVECVKNLLTQPILLGRSRRAGYGGEAVIKFTHEAPWEYENVSGWLQNDVSADEYFRVMLASAYVGRHPDTGQLDPTAIERELGDRFANRVAVERRRWAFEIVGAFNQKWRLEVPQAWAVTAGAVLILRATEKIPHDMLRDIEHEGIGERRIEGFGRLLFLDHAEDLQPLRLSHESKSERRSSEDTDAARALRESEKAQLDLVERRIVLAAARAELDRIATRDIASKVHRKQIPTSSLLGRLRTVFRDVVNEETACAALAHLKIWCSDDDNPNILKRHARHQLDRCRVGDGNLREWLRQLTAPGWEGLLQTAGNQTTLTGLAAKHYLTEVQAAQAVLHAHAAQLSVHLSDAVLVALSRRNRGGSQ